MRAAQRHATAFQVELRASQRLQALVAGLVLLACVSAVAAFAAHEARCWGLLALTPLPTWLAWRAARVAPRLLQWDGQTWRLAPAALHEPGPAIELEVAIDLDDWLLLRARTRGGHGLLRPTYLPLSRTDVGPRWGQLRATLYSARPHKPTVDESR